MNSSDCRNAFDRIFHNSMKVVGDQLVTDGSQLGLYVTRPSYSLDVQRDNQTTGAYTELIDIWADLMDQNGRLTSTGLAVANLLVNSEREETLEGYIAEKFELTDEQALNISSRAMWDLLMIRGLPVPA